MNALVVEKTSLEIFALAGTAAVPAIAIIALGVAIWQIRSNVKVVRRASAYAIYQNYLKIAMDNPEISFGDEIRIRSSKGNLEKYKWFVSIMLLSFEEILAVCQDEKDWKATMLSQLRRHMWHISVSSSLSSGHWGDDILILIEEAKKFKKVPTIRSMDHIRNDEFMVFKKSV